MNETVDVKNVVREKYGAAAERVAQGRGNACCGGSAASPEQWDPITSNLYDQARRLTCPPRRCWPRWAAATRPRWRN